MKPVDPDSEEARAREAREWSTALETVSRTRQSVTRSFDVGWEMHHGLFLVPAEAVDWLHAEWEWPDFLDDGLQREFAKAAGPVPDDPHPGQKLVCECTGVEWSFHGQKRFLVRAAKLEWR